MRAIGVMLGAAMLSGCMSAGDGLFSSRGEALARAPAQTQVMSKSFTVAGPRGFCIDTGGTRETADGAFVVLGSCAVISGNPRDAKPRQPAMLTASVTPADAPLDADALDRMTAFFSTEAGRAALARADGVNAVSVIDLLRDDGLLLVHAEDGERAGDLAGDYWRGVFEVAGQLVSVTVSGYRAAPLDGDSGAALARRFVAAIRKANRDAGAPEATQSPDVAGNGLTSFFNRLL